MKKPFCILALALAFAGTGMAQDAVAPADEPAAPETPIRAELSASDIAGRADEISAMLLEIQKAVDVEKPTIAQIPDQVSALESDIAKKLESVTPEEIDELTRSDAETRLQAFTRIDGELSAWRNSLQSYADELDGYGRQIREQQTFTDSLLVGENREDMPDTLLQRIARVDNAEDTTLESVRNKLDAVLAELTQISSLQLRIGDAIKTIVNRQKQAERDAFGFDREPLWDIDASVGDFGDNISTELGSRFDSAAEFSKANTPGIVVAFVLLVVILIAMLAGRPAIVKRAEESDIDLAQRAFIERPVALAVLLWAVLGPELLLPQAPLAIGVVRGFIVALALWRMLPVILPGAGRKSITGLLILFVAGALIEIVPLSDLALRILLLAIAAAAIYFFAEFRRALANAPTAERTVWWRLGATLAAIAPFLLWASLIGVLVGAVSLASQLITTLLVLFVLLLAVVVVEDALMATAHFFVTGWGRDWLRSFRRYPDLVRRRLNTLIRLAMLLLIITVLPRVSTSAAILVRLDRRFPDDRIHDRHGRNVGCGNSRHDCRRCLCNIRRQVRSLHARRGRISALAGSDRRRIGGITTHLLRPRRGGHPVRPGREWRRAQQADVGHQRAWRRHRLRTAGHRQ